MDCVWNILLLEWIGIGCLSGIPITFLCLGCIFPLMGFTVCGIAAGSLAACCQSAIGDVVAGSWFAWMQSIGALGHPKCCGITVILGFFLGGVLQACHQHLQSYVCKLGFETGGITCLDLAFERGGINPKFWPRGGDTLDLEIF